MMRMKTHEVDIGGLKIGHDNPIAIQSMCNTKTSDVKATVGQILDLEEAGLDIVRVAVPDEASAIALAKIKNSIHIPLVADIHFDYKLALLSIENGADKIRINPGNIGGYENLQKVVEAASRHNTPIRVGVNSGSLEKNLIKKYKGRVTAEGLVESALSKVHMIEEMGFYNIVISIKSSDVLMCIKAHELIRNETNHPLHVGITEAGSILSGNIKSAVGLGIILYEGIGDTIRVSLTGDPLEEVKSAKLILKSLGLRKDGIEVKSCPTCGRTEIDLLALTKKVEDLVALPKYARLNINIACMGCIVNGPGEALEADLAICGGKREGLIMRRDKIIRKVPENELFSTFTEELDKFL